MSAVYSSKFRSSVVLSSLSVTKCTVLEFRDTGLLLNLADVYGTQRNLKIGGDAGFGDIFK